MNGRAHLRCFLASGGAWFISEGFLKMVQFNSGFKGYVKQHTWRRSDSFSADRKAEKSKHRWVTTGSRLSYKFDFVWTARVNSWSIRVQLLWDEQGCVIIQSGCIHYRGYTPQKCYDRQREDIVQGGAILAHWSCRTKSLHSRRSNWTCIQWLVKIWLLESSFRKS